MSNKEIWAWAKWQALYSQTICLDGDLQGMISVRRLIHTHNINWCCHIFGHHGLRHNNNNNRIVVLLDHAKLKVAYMHTHRQTIK